AQEKLPRRRIGADWLALLALFGILLMRGSGVAEAALLPPSSLTARAVSRSQINLTWIDKSNTQSEFEIEPASTATGPRTRIATGGANVTSYVNTGLSASTIYYYRVRAHKAAGSAYSSYSNTASATTLATIPTAPSSLSASAVSASQINLSWTDTSTNESG